MVKKEADIRKKNRGTFLRSGRKSRNEAKWTHKNYNGWINLQRGLAEVVTVVIQSRAEKQEWQLLSAFLGWLDRHCAKSVSSVSIHYR